MMELIHSIGEEVLRDLFSDSLLTASGGIL